MINILHLASSFGMGGGAETNLTRLASHMDRARFRNTIVAMTEGVNFDLVRARLAESEVPVYSLGMRRGAASPRAAVRFCRLIRQIRPQIMQTWMYHADLLGLIAGKWEGVPSIAWNIRCSSLDAASSRWMSRMVRTLLVHLSSWPDVVLANSQSGLDFHRALGYKPRKWLYMPNSLDLDLFKPDEHAGAWLRSELGLLPQVKLIGLIARLHPAKDHKTFVRAAGILVKESPDIHFVLVGKGVEKDNSYINSLISMNGGTDRFHLLGHRTDVDHITAGLDIACSSSLSEGSPNVVAEAMACGVPCVVTDVGDSSLILQGLGKVVPPENADALAQAWRESLVISQEQRLKHGLAARARVTECFSLSKAVARYESLYEQLAIAQKREGNPKHTSSIAA